MSKKASKKSKPANQRYLAEKRWEKNKKLRAERHWNRVARLAAKKERYVERKLREFSTKGAV